MIVVLSTIALPASAQITTGSITGTVKDAQVVLEGRDDNGVCASDHFGVLAEVQIAPDPPG